MKTNQLISLVIASQTDNANSRFLRKSPAQFLIPVNTSTNFLNDWTTKFYAALIALGILR